MIISHRGANNLEPENTIPAFIKAINLGVDMIEMDVRITKDGVPVIFHDSSLNRLFGIDQSIHDLNLKEFQKLYLVSKNKEKIFLPTLEEVLSTIPKISLNLELKDFTEDFSFERRVIELITSYGWEDYVWFASKRILVHKWLREYFPYKTILLQKKRDNFETLCLLKEIEPNAVQIRSQGLVSSFISKVHEFKINVFYFYADQKEAFELAIKKGVDGILTNFPDLAIKFIRLIRQK